MQISDDRLQSDDGFAVESQRRAEDTMCRWMLRSHVDHDAVRRHAVLALHGIALERGVEHLVVFWNPLFRVKLFREFQIIMQRILFLSHIELTIGPAAL